MMDREELIRGLVAQNVPRALAEKEADRQIREARITLPPSPFSLAVQTGRGGGKTDALERIAAEAEAAGVTVYRPKDIFTPGVVPGATVWPFRLTLPWTHLISDNRKYCPALRGGKPAIILTMEYRTAKRLASIAARKAWGNGLPWSPSSPGVMLELTARVFFPNDYRKRDAHNFQKCAHDALKGIIFEDDDVIIPRWLPAGVDVDAPRAELTLHPNRASY